MRNRISPSVHNTVKIDEGNIEVLRRQNGY